MSLFVKSNRGLLIDVTHKKMAIINKGNVISLIRNITRNIDPLTFLNYFHLVKKTHYSPIDACLYTKQKS